MVQPAAKRRTPSTVFDAETANEHAHESKLQDELAFKDSHSVTA